MRLILSTTLLCFSLFASAQHEFLPSAGKVEFKTKGWPNLVTIKGEGEGLSGQLKEENGKASGQLSFNLTSLKTGIDLRDEHMKNKYLQVQTYPTAKLTIKDLAIPQELKGTIDFKGTLELHGVSKEVSGKARLETDSGKTTIKTELPIQLSDFKIEIPNYQGITVAEKVTINIESEVTHKK